MDFALSRIDMNQPGEIQKYSLYSFPEGRPLQHVIEDHFEKSPTPVLVPIPAGVLNHQSLETKIASQACGPRSRWLSCCYFLP
jgi:hypothetical protein